MTSYYSCISQPSSLTEFYSKLFQLMKNYGRESMTILDYPQTQSLLISSKLNESAKIRRMELIAQIISIQNEYLMRSVLSNFFFNIFEYLISPVRFMLILTQLYLLGAPINLSKSEQIIFNRTRGLKIKETVMFILKIWVGLREEDFIYGNVELFEMLVCFFKYVRSARKYNIAISSRSINIAIVEMKQKISRVKDKRKKFKSESSPIKRPLNHSCQEECSMIANKMILKFLSCDNQLLSKIFFMIDYKVFSRLNKYAFFPKRIGSRKNRCKNYQEYMLRFNTLLNWFIFMILKMEGAPSRAKVIHKLIKLIRQMEEGTNFTNFEAIEHIKLALSSNTIKKLRGTSNILKNSIRGKDRVCYDRIGILGSANFPMVFNLLKSTKKPCVPFLQKFIQFLVSKDAVWRTMIKDQTKKVNYVNFEKMIVLSDTLNLLNRLQRMEQSKLFVNMNKELLNHDLYRFLNKDYRKILSCTLGVDQLSSQNAEIALRNLGSNLQ